MGLPTRTHFERVRRDEANAAMPGLIATANLSLRMGRGVPSALIGRVVDLVRDGATLPPDTPTALRSCVQVHERLGSQP